jgi:glycosyltransferase involved in cell wall biosynthesis
MSEAMVPDLPITILLSTFNGGKFLREQLDSFIRQSYQNWTLFWRDDGSTDDTAAIMRDFTAEIGANRCVESPSSGPHLGATPSFLRLLAETKSADAIAFADQDDVWLPDKLSNAAASIGAASIGGAGGKLNNPVLYCARQFLVDEQLGSPKLSVQHLNLPGFPASLTQNIVIGNTVVMNQAAAGLVAAMGTPDGTVHDWWSYIVVSACGGAVVYDPRPSILYRLHKNNLIGSARLPRRAVAALRRGPKIFMTMMRRHADALAAQAGQLTPEARAELAMIRAGLNGGLLPRLRALRCKRFRRRMFLENLLFGYWFLTG